MSNGFSASWMMHKRLHGLRLAYIVATSMLSGLFVSTGNTPSQSLIPNHWNDKNDFTWLFNFVGKNPNFDTTIRYELCLAIFSGTMRLFYPLGSKHAMHLVSPEWNVPQTLHNSFLEWLIMKSVTKITELWAPSYNEPRHSRSRSKDLLSSLIKIAVYKWMSSWPLTIKSINSCHGVSDSDTCQLSPSSSSLFFDFR